jgi:FkbM family methyltransferase
VIRNRHNWRALYRALWVFENPVRFVVSLLRRSAPRRLRLRTPTGRVTLRLRNFESLKTVFSVFCREDYRIGSERPLHFLDIGANVGISAVYFLSRHSRNTVRCYEPDSGNLEFLRENLEPFGARARVEEKAVGTTRDDLLLYRAADGKYSSTLPSPDAIAVQRIQADAFADVLAEVQVMGWPSVVKLDVEGIERQLIAAIDFANYSNVERLFCESTDCGELIRRRHVRQVRNGYVEDLRFLPATCGR